jgi:truncated hemoglobin YjbI
MRHAPYAIDEAMRDRWLAHMNAALDAVTRDGALPAASDGDALAPELVGEMRDYFVRAADHLRNV